jgi:hypothetical protein
MRAHLLTLVVLVTGCSEHDESSNRTARRPGLIKPQRHPPPGPYVIGYDCSHNNAPFSDGGDVRNISVDLEAKRRIVLAYHYSAGSAQPPAVPQASPLSDPEIQKLEAAIDHVLRGGPYHPENSRSEGTPCVLSLSVPGATPFFQIAKATIEQPDAVSALIRCL